MSKNDFWRELIKLHMDDINSMCSELYFKAWEDQGKDFYVTIDRSGNVGSRICNHGFHEHGSSWYAGETIELACFSFYQVDTVIHDFDIINMLEFLDRGDILAIFENDDIPDKLGFLAEIGEYDLLHALDMDYITENQNKYIQQALKNVFDYLGEYEKDQKCGKN